VLATDTLLGGRYVLGPVLGRGGVADVFRAEDLVGGRPVAIKVLRNATANDLRRFDREANALERLDHPGIVRLCDEGEHDGFPYLVLDLVDGEPLSRVIARGPLHIDAVTTMGACLAGALAHAHELGIVHRDVKPGNVLVDRDGSVHLSDFGIARLIDAAAITSITETGFVIGTAAYLSPEQVRGQTAGPESDVYSLGLVLLEALTGERSFEGSPTESAVARLERSPEIPPLEPWLESTLGAMTATDAAQRPRAAAVADAFASRDDRRDPTAVLPIASSPTSVALRAVGFDRRRAWLVAALAALVLAIAGVVYALGPGTSGTVPPGPETSTTAVPAATASTNPVTTATPTTKAKPPKDHGRGQGQGQGGDGDG
jgi:serine/threonine protein kinase